MVEEITAEMLSILDVNSEWWGVPRQWLMENAGAAIAAQIRERHKSPTRMAIFCGTGGNGGDAMVVARHLYGHHPIDVFLVGGPERISSQQAYRNWAILQGLPNLSCKILRDSAEISDVDWKSYGLYIDGILGSGLRQSPRNPHAAIIRQMNSSRNPDRQIWSIDLPSGLLASGRPGDPMVTADLIFALHQAKTGSSKLASVIVLPIGIPSDAITCSGPGYLQAFNSHPEDSHKGDNGKVLLIGGSKDYHGAAIISGWAALKSGIDLLQIYTSKEVSETIRRASAEFIVQTYDSPFFDKEAVEGAIKLAKKNDVILLGPGLGENPKVQEAVSAFVEQWMNIDPRPGLVIDADALKYLPMLSKLGEEVIVTPHAGEFFLMTKRKLASTRQLHDRIADVQGISQQYGVTWLVKGRVDLIASKGKVLQNHTGCAAMTVGGTGDALAGITAGLYARSKRPYYSAIAAAFWTGLAGEYTDSLPSGFSTTAMVENLPVVWKELENFVKSEDNIYANEY